MVIVVVFKVLDDVVGVRRVERPSHPDFLKGAVQGRVTGGTACVGNIPGRGAGADGNPLSVQFNPSGLIGLFARAG